MAGDRSFEKGRTNGSGGHDLNPLAPIALAMKISQDPPLRRDGRCPRCFQPIDQDPPCECHNCHTWLVAPSSVPALPE